MMMMKSKKYRSLISGTLIGLALILWHQLRLNSAQANCNLYSPKTLETMNSTEPLIINESLIIEDIKKAYKALATLGNSPRTIALQFGTIDTTSLNENEVKPFNPDVQSVVVLNGFIYFEFKPNSLVSLSALQKTFGNYTVSPAKTNRNGATTTYSIRFRMDLNGENTNIIVRYISPDLTVEKLEITEILVGS
jgi:hypothetical protein